MPSHSPHQSLTLSLISVRSHAGCSRCCSSSRSTLVRSLPSLLSCATLVCSGLRVLSVLAANLIFAFSCLAISRLIGLCVSHWLDAYFRLATRVSHLLLALVSGTVFGSLFVKNFQLHHIFNSKLILERKLEKGVLLAVIACMLSVRRRGSRLLCA